MTVHINARRYSWLPLLVSLVGLVGPVGCVATGGGHVGRTVYPSRADGQNADSWGAHVQARLDFEEIARVPVHLGLELEGRSEAGQGSMLTGGVAAGYTVQLGPLIGLTANADFGFPMGWGSTATGWHWGGALELPVEFESNLALHANRNFRFLGSRAGVVPYLRFRQYRLRWQDSPSSKLRLRNELVVGAAVRVRFFTDLL